MYYSFSASSETPPAGPRMYYSFSASAEAGLVPHPRRLRLNRPSGKPSHPFKCAWSHLLRQPRLTGYSNRGDGTAVKSPFYHPLLTVQGLPCPVDTRFILFSPEPGTTLTTETPASYTGHLRGLGKAGLGTISYSTR